MLTVLFMCVGQFDKHLYPRPSAQARSRAGSPWHLRFLDIIEGSGSGRLVCVCVQVCVEEGDECLCSVGGVGIVGQVVSGWIHMFKEW